MALYNCSANSSNGNVAGSTTGCPNVDSDSDCSCGCSNGNVAGTGTCSLGGLDDSVVELLLLIAIILLIIALLN